MFNENDPGYFAARAEEERLLSEAATNLKSKEIHSRMADEYDSLSRGNGRIRPLLHIVTPR